MPAPEALTPEGPRPVFDGDERGVPLVLLHEEGADLNRGRGDHVRSTDGSEVFGWHDGALDAAGPGEFVFEVARGNGRVVGPEESEHFGSELGEPREVFRGAVELDVDLPEREVDLLLFAPPVWVPPDLDLMLTVMQDGRTVPTREVA